MRLRRGNAVVRTSLAFTFDFDARGRLINYQVDAAYTGP